MKYNINRQFTDRNLLNSGGCSDLSSYLKKNDVAHEIKGNNLQGHLGEVEFDVSFEPTWFWTDRTDKVNMKGTIKSKYSDQETHDKARYLLVLFTSYVPQTQTSL